MCENCSVFDEVKAYKKCASFYGPHCTWLRLTAILMKKYDDDDDGFLAENECEHATTARRERERESNARWGFARLSSSWWLLLKADSSFLRCYRRRRIPACRPSRLNRIRTSTICFHTMQLFANSSRAVPGGELCSLALFLPPVRFWVWEPSEHCVWTCSLAALTRVWTICRQTSRQF